MLDFSVFRVSEHSWAVLRFVEKAHEILVRVERLSYQGFPR